MEFAGPDPLGDIYTQSLATVKDFLTLDEFAPPPRDFYLAYKVLDRQTGGKGVEFIISAARMKLFSPVESQNGVASIEEWRKYRDEFPITPEGILTDITDKLPKSWEMVPLLRELQVVEAYHNGGAPSRQLYQKALSRIKELAGVTAYSIVQETLNIELDDLRTETTKNGKIGVHPLLPQGI